MLAQIWGRTAPDRATYVIALREINKLTCLWLCEACTCVSSALVIIYFGSSLLYQSCSGNLGHLCDAAIAHLVHSTVA